MAKRQTAMRMLDNGKITCRVGDDYTTDKPRLLPITRCANCDDELIPNRSYKSNVWFNDCDKAYYVCARCYEKENRK